MPFEIIEKSKVENPVSLNVKSLFEFLRSFEFSSKCDYYTRKKKNLKMEKEILISSLKWLEIVL